MRPVTPVLNNTTTVLARGASMPAAATRTAVEISRRVWEELGEPASPRSGSAPERAAA